MEGLAQVCRPRPPKLPVPVSQSCMVQCSMMQGDALLPRVNVDSTLMVWYRVVCCAVLCLIRPV